MSEAPHKKGTSWSIGIGLGIVALLIGTAIITDPSFSSSGERDKASSAGTAEPLHLQENVLTISAPGVVKASHLTMLSPGVSGKVDKVHPLFNAGEIILKGTPLLELEKFEYRARLANAQAELEQARLDVSTEQAEALKAIKKTYSSVSKSGKESELVLRVPQRRAVNARLNAAEAYVAEAEQALRDTVLEAPYTCQVVECSVGSGARVVAGQPVGKVIPLQERMIRVPVPLEEFSALPRDEQGKINTALTASCVLNNGKRLQWLGHVTAVDSALDSERNSAVLIASLEPNGSHVSEWQVAPVNMALQVNINVHVPASVWIPSQAVRDGSSIRVKTPEGVQERKVHVVALKDGKSLVTIPEFQEGDALVL
ncbi:HlyD family efflux transporter periplasmic adaptor subunit [Akkermansia sp.]|uniref:efflux RND transporter periplasmic adaptor subunit n=1 Tax=Akkermansia sp. TaxID=1872421 RepID=UPI0025C47F0F|nr:HlyD family efflux transporter periplasmic adaptor subunit [Akkermansia sp.]